MTRPNHIPDEIAFGDGVPTSHGQPGWRSVIGDVTSRVSTGIIIDRSLRPSLHEVGMAVVNAARVDTLRR